MKRLLLFLLLLPSILPMRGQTASQNQPSPLNLITPPSSPTAAGLARYIDFPVTMSSGIPGIHHNKK